MTSFSRVLVLLLALKTSWAQDHLNKQDVIPQPVYTKPRLAYVYIGEDVTKVPDQGFPQNFSNIKWGWRWEAELEVSEDDLEGMRGVVASWGGANRGCGIWLQDGHAKAIYFPGNGIPPVCLQNEDQLSTGKQVVAFTVYANGLLSMRVNGKVVSRKVTPHIFSNVNGKDQFAVGRDPGEPILKGLIPPEQGLPKYPLQTKLARFRLFLADSEPELTDVEKPPSAPFKPVPSASNGPEITDQRIKPVRDLLKKGRLQFGTLDEVVAWRPGKNYRYNKKPYPTVVVTFQKQTEFGPFSRDLLCLLRAGKPFLWLDPYSGEQRR